VIVDQGIDSQVREEFRRLKAYFVSPEEKKKMEPVCVKGEVMNPDVVGQPAVKIAKMCGFTVPEETSLLMVEMKVVGPQEPISREVLAPILGYYVEPDWMSACERSLQVLRFGGMGHTLVIHSRDPQVIMEFALKKPAYRLCVNTPSTLGAIGFTTRLFPAMSLGCGTSGGNISADNIGPLNLLNIKHLAFDIRDDAFASTMKVSEAIVSDFVPFEKREPGTSPSSAGETILYNGRPRDLSAL
jgi:acetaldehyde dehydrogenase (acetylating)